ncbi:MAG: TIGR03016 family PEP-CTERM system-associated outer membrane protein [Rhodoferax sp.]|nr:TIGR03016 family PEP-CTERM system-associated outer membrane protein [Rhodoferax sp.]
MMPSAPTLRKLRCRLADVPTAVLLMMASGGAYAQEGVADAGALRLVSVVPRVSVSEVITNNVALSSANPQSDQITQVSPGIRISVGGARLQAYFDYSRNELFYAQDSSPQRSQNALNTFGTLEVLDNWAYLDFSGNISQQAISAFGAQSVDNTSVNPNRTEVSTYRLSPYVRGRLGNVANYEARYSRAISSSDSGLGSDVTTGDAVAKVSADRAFGNLGWSADASQQTADYSAGRQTEANRLNLGLSYAITPQLSVSARAGRETNNYTTLDMESYDTSGVGLNWAPSERTKLSASLDHRPFGDAHSVSFEHRTPRTAWRFSDSKDVSTTPNQAGFASLGAIYDLLFIQFASIEPDAVARARLVNTYLQSNGINPNAPVISSFLASAVSLQLLQNLSFALLGVRDTITFVATRSESSRLDTLSVGFDPNSATLIRQRGFSVNYAHRLTPEYSLGVLASQQNTEGVSSLQDSRLRLLSINITGKFGKNAAASVGVRRVVYSSVTAPYGETAITLSLNVQF